MHRYDLSTSLNIYFGFILYLQWVILALWKMSDYRASHGDDYSSFTVCLRSLCAQVDAKALASYSQNSATAIYNLVSAQWDDTCGGGGMYNIASLDHRSGSKSSSLVVIRENVQERDHKRTVSLHIRSGLYQDS